MTTTPLSLVQIGPYECIHLLGKGAMGSVYLARDRRIGRRVALKVIHLGPNTFEDSSSADEFFGRLQREAEVGGALQHPNIVALYDVGYEDGRVSYLAMEYVEGETLLDLQRRSGGIVSQDQLRRIAAGVLRGLEYAHEKGIIHRDIKPANILIAGDGSAKIADFGIARPLESSMTRIGSLMGTPNYMSPEQAAGKDPSPKSDIFSLGVTLYDVLAGSKPFAAADLPSILNNIINQAAPPPPGPLGTLVAQMMSKSPDDRPTASQALARLNARAVVPQDPLLWIVVAACIAIAAGSFLIPEPTLPRVDPAVQQLSEKRRGLAEAQALFDNGKFAESLQKFDAYLQKYPASTVARGGRDRAREAMSPKPAAKHKRSRRDEDISPRELLRRLKKAIRGK